MLYDIDKTFDSDKNLIFKQVFKQFIKICSFLDTNRYIYIALNLLKHTDLLSY